VGCHIGVTGTTQRLPKASALCRVPALIDEKAPMQLAGPDTVLNKVEE